MISNVASVGWNLTKGLRDNGVNVVFVGNKSNVTSGEYDYVLSWKDFLRKKYGKKHFDIVHIHSPNFKKLGASWRYLTGFLLFFDAKLICHWHGSDLRFPYKSFPVYHFLKMIGDYHLYSTDDLAWWLRKIPKNKKEWFLCPVDTELFRPDKQIKKDGTVTFMREGYKNAVMHDDMPKFLNHFENINVQTPIGYKQIYSVSGFEGAACGLKVNNFPWMNREWVIENASIKSQTDKLLKIYEKVME